MASSRTIPLRHTAAERYGVFRSRNLEWCQIHLPKRRPWPAPASAFAALAAPARCSYLAAALRLPNVAPKRGCQIPACWRRAARLCFVAPTCAREHENRERNLCLRKCTGEGGLRPASATALLEHSHSRAILRDHSFCQTVQNTSGRFRRRAAQQASQTDKGRRAMARRRSRLRAAPNCTSARQPHLVRSEFQVSRGGFRAAEWPAWQAAFAA